MALIVEYHVVADQYLVGATAISAGMLVELDAANLVIPVDAIAAVNCIGVAGDSALNAEGQTTAYSAQTVIGADGGGTRWTENRVSDFYDETTASQKCTVYNGGGKFWVSTDLLDTGNLTPTVGQVYGTGTTGGDGSWLAANAIAGVTVAIAVGGVQAYPSGVPGTDIDGSISLGNYFPVVLRV